MKVQFLIEDEFDDDKFVWKDLYIDENYITGWYIPYYEDEIGESINVMFNGSTWTFKQTEKLKIFLFKKFVD